MSDRTVTAFQKIYKTHEWSGRSLSGPGSDQERTIEFRSFLEEFIKAHGVRSVVDFGCGDWSYARLVNWQGALYTGIDVVDSVIEQNRRTHGSDDVSFMLRESSDTPLPPADLFIAKEVLQHLPTADVHKVLSLASKYQYCILVNDIAHERRASWRRGWKWQEVCGMNIDIDPGGYRLLSLRDAPFQLRAHQALTYQNSYRDLRWTKEVLVTHAGLR